jgi:amino acid adenylation domain-containing protein
VDRDRPNPPSDHQDLPVAPKSKVTPSSTENSPQPTEFSYSLTACVPELVTLQAIKTPHAMAVVAGSKVLTYAQLEAESNELAAHLRLLGVGRDSVVGLCLKRSIAFVVGALGIMKAGAAYLPLDPTHPRDRLAFQLDDAQAEVLVTGECSKEEMPGGYRHVIGLGVDGRFAHKGTLESFSTEVKAEDLAYVIYTSGSTGKPKGVEINHSSLMNLISWHRSAFCVRETDRASNISGVGFDAAVWELWPYLTAGASIHVADDSVVKEPQALRDWLLAEGITISFTPTPLTERLLSLEWPSEAPLRIMLTGADTLHHYPRTKLPFQLVNNYGPTECTVVATSALVPPANHSNHLPPIGWPITNTQVYVVDENKQQVPAGGEGEIWIGGKGVARGYRNRPDLTLEKFIPNPFEPGPGGCLYCTGDRGRYLPDGQIAFMGRIDEQIKVRGFRIEPGEIEAVLNEHSSVQETVVVAREFAEGDKRIVAYLVLKSEPAPTLSELQAFLASRLPEHMMPSKYVTVASLPLNHSGKIHRAALPAPDFENSLQDDMFVSPRTPIEERIAGIVAPLLGLERVSAEDNFFLLGGHSLLGTQLIGRIRDAFGIELPLRSIFDSPTIAELASQVEQLLLVKLESMSDEAQRVLNGQTRSAILGGA